MTPSDDETNAAGDSGSPLPRNVRLLGATSLINDVASEMIFPLLPTFLLTQLGGNKFSLGVIEGVADSTASLLKLFAGSLSDRCGSRKGFVVAGYLTAAVVRPLTGLATAPWHLFAVRTTDRIGKGIRTAPRDALIADSTPAEQRGRAFGFHRSMDHLGAAIGPLLAMAFLWMWPDALRALFLWTALPGLLVVLLVVFGLREAKRTPSDKEPFRFAGQFDRPFWLYLASLVVFTLGNSSDAFLLVRAGELGVPTYLLPLLWFAFHVVKSIGNYCSGPVVDRLGPRPLILVGWALYAAVYVAFAAVSNAWQVSAVFLAYGVFYALTEPAEKTLVAQLVDPARRGLAFGWFNFAIGVAALPSSLLFGWLYQDYGAWTAFGCGAVLSAAASVMLLGVRTNQAATS